MLGIRNLLLTPKCIVSTYAICTIVGKIKFYLQYNIINI